MGAGKSAIGKRLGSSPPPTDDDRAEDLAGALERLEWRVKALERSRAGSFALHPHL